MNIKNKIFLNKGLYDNKKVFENTIDAIKLGINNNLGLYLTVRETKDHELIIYEDSNLSRLNNVKDKIDDMTYEDLTYLSFYHIPKLKEVLELINGKVYIILNLKIKSKNKEIFSILNNYHGKFIILAKTSLLIKLNRKNNNINIGEIMTKKSLNLFDFLIKSTIKSIDISFYDKLKIKKMKEDNNILIGYLIDDNDLLKEYKDIFDYLIVDNYTTLKFGKE